MNKIRLFLLRLLMPKHFKEVLLDTVFSSMNDDVERLTRQLHKMNLVKKEKKNGY